VDRIPPPIRSLLGEELLDEELEVREGQFHTVVIGSDRVVCLARTPAAAARLPHRAATLQALAELDLGCRVPQPLASGGFPGSEVPAHLVLDRLPGSPLESAVLADPSTARAVAAQYAKLLSRFRRAGHDAKSRNALRPDARDRWKTFAAAVRDELFPLMSTAGQARADRELDGLASLPYRVDAVVHGDLGSENVLWEDTVEGPRLGGVIDWDEASLGDPAEDLAAIGASHGRRFLDRVIAAGGWNEPDLYERITAITATFALQQALQAVRDDDEDELDDGLSSYR
jgi:aminoglycoside phosphotransferase (APT) family kinase protein